MEDIYKVGEIMEKQELILLSIVWGVAVLVGIIATLTSPHFWKCVKIWRCKHCDGTGEVEHVGEEITEPCEHCTLVK
jgi:hypothetical protein